MTQLLNNRYQIIGNLGRGGFGETFLAEDTYMPSRRRCVIKQLKPLVDNPQVYQLVQDRFQREAAILEALGEGHPQIPNLYAYFSEAGQFYLIQEWIEGDTLTHCVKKEGLFDEEALQNLLLNFLPILDYIHAQGIIHRDIKPDNIILRQRDRLPVAIDFGAVRETMGTQMNAGGDVTSSIVIGTPGFMPSEQAAGRPLYSSDLYSLGLTAIFLLTGLFPRQLQVDTHTGEIIWPQEALHISPPLKTVLERAIQSHPRDRIPTATEMLDALQSHASVSPIAATIPPPEYATVPSPSSQDAVPPTISLSERPPEKKRRNNRILRGAIAGGLVSVAISFGFFLDRPENPLEKIGSDNNYAWLSERKITDTDLTEKTAFELAIMRNSIYARYGREFLSPELQTYFNNQSWYDPRYSPDEFPNNRLSSLEIYNAIYILKYQNTHNLRWIQDNLSSSQKPSAKQAIENYYSLINSNQYLSAWNLLSPRQHNDNNLHPNGYNSYLDWWQTVDRVELEAVNLIEEGVEVARLEVRLKYYMKTGAESSNTLRFKLLWSEEVGRWSIDDVKLL